MHLSATFQTERTRVSEKGLPRSHFIAPKDLSRTETGVEINAMDMGITKMYPRRMQTMNALRFSLFRWQILSRHLTRLGGVLLAGCLVALSASAEVSGNWEYWYSDEDSTATVTKYTGSLSSPSVPSTVSRTEEYAEQDEDGEWHTRHRTYTYKVTAISGTFYGNQSITSVALPASVTVIGAMTFFNCTSLASFHFHEGITSIGGQAFQGCTGLTKVKTPSSLEEMGQMVFAHCSNLETAELNGSGLKRLIGSDNLFNGCGNLRQIFLGDGVTGLPPLTGCTNLQLFVAGKGVVDVENCYFQSVRFNNKLSVSFEGPLQSVGPSAFGNSAISKLNIAFDKEKGCCLSDNAFGGCVALNGNLDLRGIVWVDDMGGQFWGCTGITNVVWTRDVPFIPETCFSSCTGLLSATITKNVLQIGAWAFENCTALSDVWFEGAPPTVDHDWWNTSPFSGVAEGARGHYTEEYAEAWKEVIDPATGKWEGLIFQDPVPELRVDSADPTKGSLTLAWEDSASTGGVTYSVYRSASSSYSEMDRVTNGLTATSWIDTNYWAAEPVLKPLNYWVVAEGGGYEKRESEPVETRHRHGVFVGVGQYEMGMFRALTGQGWFDPSQDLSDITNAELFGKLARDQGDFTYVKVMAGIGANKEAVRKELQSLAERLQTGDYIVLFFSSHGDWDFWNTIKELEFRFSGIVLYDDTYEKDELRADLKRLMEGKNGMSVVCVVNSCLSGGAVSATPANEHVAWITSCQETQLTPSWTEIIGTPLPYFLLEYGWNRGCAGENAFLTFADLADYALPALDVFMKKVLKVNNPVIEEPDVLAHFIAGRPGNAGKHDKAPDTPVAFSATTGDEQIQLSWSGDSTADAFLLGREDLDGSHDQVFLISGDATLGKDPNAESGKTYRYYIAAMNDQGYSNWSRPEEGRQERGTMLGWLQKKGVSWIRELFDIAPEEDMSIVIATIESAFSTTGMVILPSELAGYVVTKIPDSAFENCGVLTGLSIPASVTYVGANAFAGCDELATLYVPAAWEGTDMLAAAGVPEGCEVVYGGVVRQTVHFDANGGTSKKASVTCAVGGKYSGFPTATWENHVFQGWYDDPEGGNRVRIGMEVTAVAERTLYAHWKKQTVHFDTNGGRSKKESVTCYVGGTYSGFPACTWENHVFLGWYDDPEGGSRVKNGMQVTADSERTLYAHWKRQTVRFDANGGTCKKKSVTCYVGGTYTTLASASWDGRKFLGWYNAPTGGNRVKLGMEVTADAERTLYAHWEQTIRFDGNGGTIKKASVTCVIGETYTTLASAKWDGRKFLGWYDAPTGGNRVKLGMEVTADAERTLYAHWEQTVRFDGNGGTCSKTTATYVIGETYSGFKTATRNGFTFKGWYTAKKGGARVKNGMTVTADAERTLYAHWQAAVASLSITGFSRSSRPVSAVRDARVPATECTIRVETIADAVYEIQWTPALGGAWTVLKRWTADADGETAVSVSVPAGEATGFFRVREVAD